MRLSVVEQSLFVPPGQYGRRVTRVNTQEVSTRGKLFTSLRL